MTVKYKFVITDKDKRGNIRCYLRHEGRKVRLAVTQDHEDFLHHYNAALAGTPLSAPKKVEPLVRYHRPSAKKDGFVYFLRVGDFVKIGFSRDPLGRLDGLRTGMPGQITTFVFAPGSMRDERKFQYLFRNYRARGEWFAFQEHLGVVMGRVAKYAALPNTKQIEIAMVEKSVPL